MRSIWKPRTLPSFLYRNNLIFRLQKSKPFLKIFKTSFLISRLFLNKNFRLYSGKKFKVLKILNRDSMWKYMGEFNLSKKVGSSIHLKKSKKKSKKKKIIKLWVI